MAGVQCVKTADIVYKLYTDILYSFPLQITIKTFSIKGVIEMSRERKTVEDTLMRRLWKKAVSGALHRMGT